MKSLAGRGIATLVALIAYAVTTIIYAPPATLMSAREAGRQFENSDAAATTVQYALGALGGVNALLSLVLGLVLLAIWWVPVRRWFAALGAAVLLVSVVPAEQAAAYYDKTDLTEAYTILPNETAFWIPDTGANKDTQGVLESEEYLKSNRVAVKRFIVPHQKLSGSGSFFSGSGSFFDSYVPSGRLIIVDRTPFSREWVASHARGTSPKDESFPCQSKEGLNISVGVSIGVSVLETNAAKYLYRFGVLSPAGDRTDPRVIFTSLYFSRKLADVMDDVGRKKVQTLVCEQIASRSFDQVNAEAVAIMNSVRESATKYFGDVGITLDFIGWADTFTFDQEVQAAVNRRYIAAQDQAIAAMLQPYTSTIQALAGADALRSFGHKTDGKLPTTVVGLPADLGGLMGTLLKAAPAPAGPAPAAAAVPAARPLP